MRDQVCLSPTKYPMTFPQNMHILYTSRDKLFCNVTGLMLGRSNYPKTTSFQVGEELYFIQNICFMGSKTKWEYHEVGSNPQHQFTNVNGIHLFQ